MPEDNEVPGIKTLASPGYQEGRRKWALDFVHSHTQGTNIDRVLLDAQRVEDYLSKGMPVVTDESHEDPKQRKTRNADGE